MKPMDWDDSDDNVPVSVPGKLSKVKMPSAEALRAAGLIEAARFVQEKTVRRLVKQGYRMFRAYDEKRGRILLVKRIDKKSGVAVCETLKGTQEWLVELADLYVHVPRV